MLVLSLRPYVRVHIFSGKEETVLTLRETKGKAVVSMDLPDDSYKVLRSNIERPEETPEQQSRRVYLHQALVNARIELGSKPAVRCFITTRG